MQERYGATDQEIFDYKEKKMQEALHLMRLAIKALESGVKNV